MIYKNKTQSQNLSLYKQRDPSFLEMFRDYDKYKLKKKAGFYFRITIKQKLLNKKIQQKNDIFSHSKLDALNKAFKKRVLQKEKKKSFECKFHEDQLSFSSRSRRIVGYTSHGDLFTKHF